MTHRQGSEYISAVTLALCLLIFLTLSIMLVTAEVSSVGVATSGTIQYTQYACSIEQSGSGYTVKTAQGSWYYSDANDAVDAGLSKLTPGRTKSQAIRLIGNFELKRPISIQSYTTLDTYSAIMMAVTSYKNMFEASDAAYITLKGGNVDGARHIEHAVSFANVSSFVIKDMVIAWTWSHSVYLVSSKNGYIRNVEASHAEFVDSYGLPRGQDGFVITRGANNITFDGIYVHDIWMEHAPRPDYESWGGGVEIMTYPGAEPRNIRVLNSKFVHLGEFGVGISSNGLGLHVYNVEVANNTFRNIGKEAIDACFIVNGKISANVINTTERYGIEIYAAGSTSEKVKVNDNRIINAGYLIGTTVAGINTDGAGDLININFTRNVIISQVGLRIIPRVTSTFVDRNDFSGCDTDVLNWSYYVTWGTNVNQYGQLVIGKEP